ncbi:hypothetical protein HMPREF9098_2440 [Kingella denitrificans ATCC 33394]|uniref:Uncharacterized protein n=1 Tax=Kingella denitrificans ATCC 33394 TaxID=888741 RepID=F0F2V5_9NEIS|nr:hypothetical protein HMPREF9098_2440 [Kingella denitrificans ATCC 33394]
MAVYPRGISASKNKSAGCFGTESKAACTFIIILKTMIYAP